MVPKRNVLLMVADDLGRQLGCYGDPMRATPQIDALASGGVLFPNAFASTASCSVSRSTLYTGQHNHQNGQYGLQQGVHHFSTFDGIESGPSLLNDHGYLTGIIGKIHVAPKSVYPWTVREESHTRDVAHIGDRVGAFFDKSIDEDKPFFLTVGFIDPHRDGTRSGWGNNNTFDERVKKNTFDPDEVPIPEFLNDGPGTRKELASYYESVNRMDQGVGFILDNLQNRSLVDDTLIFFLSDNGSPFINSKTTLYDAGVNLPLIVRRPSEKAELLKRPEVDTGTVNPNLVSWVDILPTILDWCKHPSSTKPNPDSPRLGRSILPILDSTEELDDWGRVYGSHTFHGVYNYWPTRYIRNRRYKYHRNMAWRLDFPMASDLYAALAWEEARNSENRSIGGRALRDYFMRPPEELYDLKEDPKEIHNLADSKDHADVVKELSEKLELWQRRSSDTWLYRDGISLLALKNYVKQGLEVPARVDFDPDEPQSDGFGHVTDISFGPEVDWKP